MQIEIKRIPSNSVVFIIYKYLQFHAVAVNAGYFVCKSLVKVINKIIQQQIQLLRVINK